MERAVDTAVRLPASVPFLSEGTRSASQEHMISSDQRMDQASPKTMRGMATVFPRNFFHEKGLYSCELIQPVLSTSSPNLQDQKI
jgi:hypothetical protein